MTPAPTRATRTIAIVFPDWHECIFPDDPDASHRSFEKVVRVISRTAPLVHVHEPGTALLAARGPSRYHGGDEAVAARLLEDCTTIGLSLRCGVGIADGQLAARIAAARGSRDGVARVVPPGRSPDFLSRLPVSVLHRHGEISHDTVDLLQRLGLRTLASVAGLDERSLIDRFGAEGGVIHRLVHGDDVAVFLPDDVPTDFSLCEQWDTPLQSEASVVATLHDSCVRFVEQISSRGLQCIRVRISMYSDHDEVSDRVWHEQRGFTVGSLVDRVRWQLSGWVDSGARDAPTAGVIRVEMAPLGMRQALAEQQQLWGGRSDHDERVARAVTMARAVHADVQVTVPQWQGGRDVLSVYGQVDASVVDLRDAKACLERVSRGMGSPQTWSGSLIRPLPITLHHTPVDVELVDARGKHVMVTGRHELSSSPAILKFSDHSLRVRQWAGPWPLEERWWDVSRRRRFARLQVLVDTRVVLLHMEKSRWTMVAEYD